MSTGGSDGSEQKVNRRDKTKVIKPYACLLTSHLRSAGKDQPPNKFVPKENTEEHGMRDRNKLGDHRAYREYDHRTAGASNSGTMQRNRAWQERRDFHSMAGEERTAVAEVHKDHAVALLKASLVENLGSKCP